MRPSGARNTTDSINPMLSRSTTTVGSSHAINPMLRRSTTTIRSSHAINPMLSRSTTTFGTSHAANMALPQVASVLVSTTPAVVNMTRPALAVTGNVTPKWLSTLGLPMAPEPQPGWVTKADVVVVDAHANGKEHRNGGILFVQTVLMNKNDVWGEGKTGKVQRPRWLRAILATNKAHIASYGHSMLIRWDPVEKIP